MITVEEMREALQKFAFQMSDEECTAIMRHFDTRQDGQISSDPARPRRVFSEHSTERQQLVSWFLKFRGHARE